LAVAYFIYSFEVRDVIMTRIDFYLKAVNKEEVAGKLVAKAFKSGACVFVNIRELRLARVFDNYLWTTPQLSFLPHVLSGHPLSAKSPVLIGGAPVDLQRYDVLINLEPEVPANFSRFERVLEIVSNDASEMEIARNRYRHYKDRGYLLDIHELGST
jgi:DNA polymerase III subunit chi